MYHKVIASTLIALAEGQKEVTNLNQNPTTPKVSIEDNKRKEEIKVTTPQPPISSPETPEETKKYIELGVNKLKDMMDDLNFIADDSLKIGKPTITNMYLPKGGGAEVTGLIPITCPSEEVAEEIIKKSKMFSIPDVVKKYIDYSLEVKEVEKKEGSIFEEEKPRKVFMDFKFVIKVPEEVIKFLAPDEVDWIKRGKAVESFIKKAFWFSYYIEGVKVC